MVLYQGATILDHLVQKASRYKHHKQTYINTNWAVHK